MINASRAMLNNDTYLAFLFKSYDTSFMLYNSQSRPTLKNHTLHVSVSGGVGIYVHVGVQVDTDNFIIFWNAYDVINFIFLP